MIWNALHPPPFIQSNSQLFIGENTTKQWLPPFSQVCQKRSVLDQKCACYTIPYERSLSITRPMKDVVKEGRTKKGNVVWHGVVGERWGSAFLSGSKTSIGGVTSCRQLYRSKLKVSSHVFASAVHWLGRPSMFRWFVSCLFTSPIGRPSRAHSL